MFIETKELKKTFRTDAGEIQVLKGIDLSIEVGEMVGIVGASGVGKSTLLHILGVLDEPTSGKVFYNAADVFSLDGNSLSSFRNKTVGFVFQFHHLMPEFTALENVMMPGLIQLSHQVERRQLCGCSEKSRGYPWTDGVERQNKTQAGRTFRRRTAAGCRCKGAAA